MAKVISYHISFIGPFTVIFKTKQTNKKLQLFKMLILKPHTILHVTECFTELSFILSASAID